VAGDAAADSVVVAGQTTVEPGGDTKNIAEKTASKTKDIAVGTAEKAQEIAGAVATTTKDVVSTTGEAITDGWITTKVSAKFVDEALLKGSDINVDTKEHVVTLNGSVTSETGKARAAAIARDTEGVTRVVNHLVVGAK
jgi:osmotically-inducible protein OsmY